MFASTPPQTIAADGSGFINFAVPGSVDARCAAPGHVARAIALKPGTRRVRLDAGARSVVVPGACGPSANPNDNRRECAVQVAASSANWAACSARGDNPACHRYVREVARALAFGNPRWGLISKPRGQQSCSATACGPDVGGYGQDVAAYRPDGAATSEWIGFDLVDKGARLDIKDTIYQSSPLGWAEYLGKQAIADYLRARGAPR